MGPMVGQLATFGRRSRRPNARHRLSDKIQGNGLFIQVCPPHFFARFECPVDGVAGTR